MQIPILPLALGAIVLTFAVAVLAWWVASRVERRRRTARRTAGTNRSRDQHGGAEHGGPGPS